MAKRMRPGGRGISTYNPTANRQVARPAAYTLVYRYTPPQPISYHDQRTFRPDRWSAPPSNIKRSATRINLDKVGKSVLLQTKAPLRFAVPHKVHLCVKRKTRREVIHAKGIAGTRTRPGRRNFWSSIKC